MILPISMEDFRLTAQWRISSGRSVLAAMLEPLATVFSRLASCVPLEPTLLWRPSIATLALEELGTISVVQNLRRAVHFVLPISVMVMSYRAGCPLPINLNVTVSLVMCPLTIVPTLGSFG